MKAMILCAGKGTRLRPLTLSTPKPMIPLVDKPVMEYIIEHLRRHDVTDIAVNLSYLPERIHNYFRDGRNHGVDIFYSYEGEMVDGAFAGEAIGSAGGLKKIQNETGFFDDTFLVLCGDAAVNLDIRSLVAEHKRRGALATIVLKNVDKKDVHKYGVVAQDATGRITKFQEKPKSDEAISTTANTGIYIFEPEILNYIPDDREFDLGGELFPILAETTDRFYGAVADFDWLDIGNVTDFRAAARKLLTNPPAGMRIPGEEIAPGLFCGPNVKIDLATLKADGPLYIGSGSVVEPNARFVGPCVVGQNCHIGANAIVHEAVMGDHIRLRANTLITKAIAYDGWLIDSEGHSEAFRVGDAVCDARCSSQRHSVRDTSLVDLSVLTNMDEAPLSIAPLKRKAS